LSVTAGEAVGVADGVTAAGEEVADSADCGDPTLACPFAQATTVIAARTANEAARRNRIRRWCHSIRR